MSQEGVRTETRMGEVGEYVVNVPIPSGESPAPGADAQKPKVPATPAAEADDKNSDAVEAVEETPEEIEAKRESRRTRSNARKAAELASARTEARMLREQLDSLRTQPKPQNEGPQDPKREDFQDYEAYLRAVAEHGAEQVTTKTLKADREGRENQEKQRSSNAAQEKIAKDWTERESAFKKEVPDYEEAIKDFLEDGLGTLSQEARMAIAESEVGPRLLHHLSKNDEVAERIAGLPPLQQVKELGKLEAKLPAEKPKGKTASDAPPPIKQTSTGRSASQGYSENMSDAEYREWRKGNGARWAR